MELGLSPEKWNKLKCVLSCGSKGSSILVSTRDYDVATIMGTCEPHHLSGLSDDNCWILFKQYAFGSGQGERPELVAIGKEIVKKCGGSPLAAQALGGIMLTKREEKEWLEVKDSKLWTLSDENSIMPALRLSYMHLTPTLKQCFAICAIFPKDTIIWKENLIHLWMASGFISSRENMEVEDVGHIIWSDLCRKSFFQDIKTSTRAEDISFKMHDLVHDLAQSVAGQECLVLEDSNMNDLSRNTHHVGFASNNFMLSLNVGALEKVESLRTLYQLNYKDKIIDVCFPTTCSLRFLMTSSLKLSSFKNLIHLRYLELDGHWLEMQTLPDSISSLRMLEILKLKGFNRLTSLPKSMNCLQNLRHLVISYCDALSHIIELPCLACVKRLDLYNCNNSNGLLSSFYGITTLELCGGEDLVSFQEGTLRNLVYPALAERCREDWHMISHIPFPPI